MAARLRNFDLTVDEIKIIKAIKDLSTSLDGLALSDQASERGQYFLKELGVLERKLEDIRENTLIQ